VKVDRTPPQLTLSGFLVDAAGQLFNQQPYDLAVDATDSLSGVKALDMTVDGAPVQHLDQAVSPTDGSPLSGDWSFDATQYSPGTHTIVVTATDYAGNQSSQTLTEQINDVGLLDMSDQTHQDPTAADISPDDANDPGGTDTTSISPGYTNDNYATYDLPAVASEVLQPIACDTAATDGASPDCNLGADTNPLDLAVQNEPALVTGQLTPSLVGLLSPGAQLDDTTPRQAYATEASSGPLSRGASGWGISDQNPGIFNSKDPLNTLLVPLQVKHARLIVPWDVVLRGVRQGSRNYMSYNSTDGPNKDGVIPVDRRTNELANADKFFATVLPCKGGPQAVPFISFEHTAQDHHGDSLSHVLPTPTEYEEGVRAFLDRYKRRCGNTMRPRQFSAWNEPNIGGQPTHGPRMERAGVYWSRLNHLCKLKNTSGKLIYNCTVAAGEMVDDNSLFVHLRDYQKGMNYGSRPPAEWALHAYHTGHVTPSNTPDKMQAQIKRFLKDIGPTPKLWLTEQGGEVHKFGHTGRLEPTCVRSCSFRPLTTGSRGTISMNSWGPPSTERKR